MKHKTYIREGTGKNVVLLIHGIAGTPDHFRDLVPVIPETFSVYNILLDGHSGTVREFSRSSMDKWKEQVHITLKSLLARHEKVVIVAHSMGTLFAIQAAIDHPDRIPALFLLNVPTRPRVHPRAMIGGIQAAFGRPRSATARAMCQDTGIALTPKLWVYLGWIPRLVELLVECRRVRKILPRLTVPTLAFHSSTDELVSPESRKDLTNPCVQNILLTDSGHFGYSHEDTALLQHRLLEILERI